MNNIIHLIPNLKDKTIRIPYHKFYLTDIRQNRFGVISGMFGYPKRFRRSAINHYVCDFVLCTGKKKYWTLKLESK